MRFVGPDTQMIQRPAHFQEKWVEKGRYRLPHPDRPGERLNAERASNFAKTISNTFTLNMWHQRKIVEGMSDHQSLVLEAVELRSKFRYEMEKLDREPNGHTVERIGELKAELKFKHQKDIQKVARQAAKVAGAKEPSSRGTYLHNLTLWYDKGLNPEPPDPWNRDMLAYQYILRKMGIRCEPEFTEKSIWIRELNIAGTFDRLVRYLRITCPTCGPDVWRVLDLKTGRDLQYGWAEIPIQLLIYAMGDVICDPQDFQCWDPMPPTCTHLGLVLHLPEGQGRATVFEVDLATQIEVEPMAGPIDLAFAVKKWRNQRRLARPVAHVEVSEHGEIIDRPLSWQEQIDLATSEAELDAIKAEAKAVGEWHGGLTKRKNERLGILAS